MAVTRIQSVKTGFTSTAAQTITWASSPVAGNLLIMTVDTANNSSATNSVSTPTGWTAGPTKLGSSGSNRGGVFLFWKIAAGSDANPQITVANSSATAVLLEEWSGLAPSSPVDLTFTGAAINNVSGSVSAGAGTTTNAADWIYCALGGFATSSLTPTWTGGQSSDVNYTSVNNVNSKLSTSTQSVSVAGSYTPGATLANAIVGGVVAVGFKQLPIPPLVAAVTYGGATGTSLDLGHITDPPASPTAGNLLVAVVTAAGTSAPTCSTPAGWTLAASKSVSGANCCAVWIFYKIASGGETLPAFTVGSCGGGYHCFYREWSGIDGASPLDATGAGAASSGTSSPITLTDSLTPAHGSLVVAAAATHPSVSSGGDFACSWPDGTALDDFVCTAVLGSPDLMWMAAHDVRAAGPGAAISLAATFTASAASPQGGAEISAAFKLS